MLVLSSLEDTLSPHASSFRASMCSQTPAREKLPAVPAGRQRAGACQARKASASEPKPCLGPAPERGRPLTLPYLPPVSTAGAPASSWRQSAIPARWSRVCPGVAAAPHLFRTSGFTQLLKLLAKHRALFPGAASTRLRPPRLSSLNRE